MLLPVPPPGPFPAVNVAFVVVFGAFVVAFAVLTVVTLTWAVRRDRAGRAQWLRRRMEEGAVPGSELPAPRANGHRPAGGPAGGEGSRR